MPSSPAPSLTLPRDIYGLVFRHLRVSDIAVLRQTCKEFYDLSLLRSLWDEFLRHDVINQNIPIPKTYGKRLTSMSASELETCYRNSLELHRNWVSRSPRIQRQFTLTPNARPIGINVLPGHSGNWILSLSLIAGRQRMFILQCWDIGGTAAICLARRDLVQFRGIAVNRVASEHGILAILNPEIEILCIDPQATNPDFGFVSKTCALNIDEATTIHCFVDSRILTRRGIGTLELWDINVPDSKCELQNPQLIQATPVVDILVSDDLIVIMRATTIEIYENPSGPPFTSATSPIFPVLTFKWPWSIDNGVMSFVKNPLRHHKTCPIDIVVRFRSYYPWALNILHHYSLYPNIHFLGNEAISEHNIPYQLAPVLRESIASPVRLHGISDMAIGPYGTAMWTDTHTEDYFNQGDRGQRVAGIFSRYYKSEGEEIELSDQIATATATSVYAYQEDDTWVRIAMDEVEGRIFLGRDDGTISVLEYI